VLRQNGVADRVISALKNVEVTGIFDEVTPDSETTLVEKGAGLAREAGADYLLAVGGGSCIDTAKAINIVFTTGGDLRDYEGFGLINSPLTPLAAVPTTAGTGSEVTQYALILDKQNRYKISFLSPYLSPALAVLDPEMTVSLPPALTASTGMDALGHAVESFVSSSSGPFARGLAAEACALIFNHLPQSVADGNDLGHRMAMLLASNLAGIAFSISMVGCAHALAHALGALKGVPHAVAVGLMLPHSIRYNSKEGADPYAGLSFRLFGGSAGSELLADKVSWLLQECGLPLRLSELDLSKDDLAAVAESAAVDGAMYTNPRAAGPEELLALLRDAW
jgi:alcohol dehydrogenase